MMKPRILLLLVILSGALLAPAAGASAGEAAPYMLTATDESTLNTDSAPLTLDQDQIDALTEAANETSTDDESVFEKASNFVTDNAPWFIIGIIILAAIVAGILIMRGRPRGEKAARAGGSQSPSAAELRRRKRAAIQRSREEERMRRKAGIEGRKAARGGASPAAMPTAVSPAPTTQGPGELDPIEAEKQGARDQETAAAAMARYGSAQAPGPPAAPPGQVVPAPVSPSQTAPAAGVVTPGSTSGEAVPSASSAEDSYSGQPDGSDAPGPEPGQEAGGTDDPAVPSEAETSVMAEPSIENPGPDAAVGSAAQAFLAGGAAGAAGGLAAARASRSEADRHADPEESLDPVIAPEPGLPIEHALTDAEPVAEEPRASGRPDAEAAAAEELRAKVAELKATQRPGPLERPPAAPAPEPPGPETDLSPGLAAVERRLSENSEERDRALREAEERLRRVEQRAEEAERRAAFAERLAQLKVEESEREKRLNDVVSGIDRAEQRAREAESRAEAAERAAAEALERSDLRKPGATPIEPPAPPAPEPPAPETGEPGQGKAGIERRELFGGAAGSSGGTDTVSLNSATFEELREAGLSVTQATRILAYRERFGGYGAVEDLEKVPGFPADLIESLRDRLSV